MARTFIALISIIASVSLCTAARPRFDSLFTTNSAFTGSDLTAAATSDLSFVSLSGSDNVIGAVMHPRHRHAASTDGGLEIAASVTLPGSDNEIVTRVRRYSNDASTTAAAAADAAVAAAVARYEQELSDLVTLPGSDDDTVSFASTREAPDAADTDTATAEESTVKEANLEEPTVEDVLMGDVAASVTLPGSDNEIVSFVPTHKTTGAAVRPEDVAASVTLPGSDNEIVSFVPTHKTTGAAVHPEDVAASVTLPGSDNESVSFLPTHKTTGAAVHPEAVVAASVTLLGSDSVIVSFVPRTKKEAASLVEASVILPGSVTIIPYSAFTSRPDQPSVAAQ